MRGPMPCAPSSKAWASVAPCTSPCATEFTKKVKCCTVNHRSAPATRKPPRASPQYDAIRAGTRHRQPEGAERVPHKAALVVQPEPHEAAAPTHTKWKMSICGMSSITPAMAQPKCE